MALGNVIDPNMLGLGILTGLGIAFAVGISLIMYIYFALVLSTIGKKLKVGKIWMAWVPVVNMFYIPMLAGYKWYYGFLWLLAAIPIIGALISIGLVIWWWWKIAEKRNFPGWISILILIPIVDIILPGVIAWYDVQKK